jgi:peptidoglycan/LPS O-acetylase OafA/YrhL
MVPSALDLLRPKPFRGDVVAAGVVVLTTLVGVVAVRFDEAWRPGAHLAYALVAWLFVTAMAVLAPMERDEPRAYQSVLYVSSVALFIAVVVRLGEVVGSDGVLSSAGTTTWVMAAFCAYALVFAVERNSAACTLIGALTGGIAVLAAVQWAWHPSGLATPRWVLLALMVVYAFAAIGQRDRRLRHGVVLIDAAGLAALAIAVTLTANTITFSGRQFPMTVTGVAWGWELLIVAAGFGLIAYSSVDRQPGPAYLGVLNLVAFTIITSLGVSAGGATLRGWPIALAVAAAALLAIGLRPTTPAPPAPDADVPEAPPLPLRGH